MAETRKSSRVVFSFGSGSLLISAFCFSGHCYQRQVSRSYHQCDHKQQRCRQCPEQIGWEPPHSLVGCIFEFQKVENFLICLLTESLSWIYGIFFHGVVETGLGFSKGGVLGKMVFLAQIVLFLLSGTGLTSFRSKIRLEAFSTSLLFIFRELLVDLVASS